MRLLLDSHVLLWWASDPAALAAGARTAIQDPANEVWASVASAWEFSIKARAGKLTVDVHGLFQSAATQGLGILGIGVDDAVLAGGIAWSHRDPFDRMLAAQAQRMGLVLVTRDTTFGSLPGLDVLPA